MRKIIRPYVLLVPALAFMLAASLHVSRPLPEYVKAPELLLLALMNGGVVEFCGQSEDGLAGTSNCRHCSVCSVFVAAAPEIILVAARLVSFVRSEQPLVLIPAHLPFVARARAPPFPFAT